MITPEEFKEIMNAKPIFCNHPECPYNDCRFNQMYVTFEDMDKDIWFVDMKCQKYLDI